MAKDHGMEDHGIRQRRRLGELLAAHRLVLFDLDDTLCDYSLARSRRLARAFGGAFAASDRPPPDDLDGLIARSIATDPHGVEHFPEVLAGYRLSPPAIMAAQQWYRANRFYELAFFAETTAALDAVRHQPVAGRRLGIITNGPAEVQRAKVELLGVGPLVDFIVISGEFGAEKPDPAIFREALRRGDADAAAAIYIGDSTRYDVAGAQAAGLAAVWVNRDGAPWAGDGPPPAATIRNIAEIARAIPAVAPGAGADRRPGPSTGRADGSVPADT